MDLRFLAENILECAATVDRSSRCQADREVVCAQRWMAGIELRQPAHIIGEETAENKGFMSEKRVLLSAVVG